MSPDIVPMTFAEIQKENHAAQLAYLFTMVQQIAADLDALARRVNMHIIGPCDSQPELAALRTVVRGLTNRIAALEEGRPRPPEGGKHAPV